MHLVKVVLGIMILMVINSNTIALATSHQNGLLHGMISSSRASSLYDTALDSCLINDPILEAKSLNLTLEPKTRNKALIRSLIIPGYGQFYKGDNLKGYAFFLSSAGAATLAIVSQINRNYAVDCYIDSKLTYDSAVSQPYIDFAYAQMQKFWKEIEHQEDMRNYSIAAFAGIWLINVIDASLGFPLSNGGAHVSLGTSSEIVPVITIYYRTGGSKNE